MRTSIVTRSKYVYLLCLTLLLLSAGAAFAYDNSASFTGQGTTGNTFNTTECGIESGAPVNGPYIYWVLTAAHADHADITGPWGTAPMTASPGGGAFKFVSAWYDFSTLPGNVSATYDGDDSRGNVQLVISHGCAECTKPATPNPNANGPSCIGADPVQIQLTAGTTADSYAWTGPGGFSSTDQNPSATITGPGSYSYSLTVTVNGCTSAAGTTNVVVVNPIPPTPSPTNDGPHCFDSNPTAAHLSAGTTADSYSWTGPDGWTSSDQNPTVSLGAPGSYTYSLTVTTNGCTSDSGSTTVVINPLPDVSVSASGPTTFCVGGSVTLTATASGNGPISYHWSNGATTASITVGGAGSYSVTVTDANGCSKSSSATVVTTLQCACALTQGAYGSTGGAGTVSQVSALIGSSLTAGAGLRSFNVLSADAACLVSRLPAGGTPAILPSGPSSFTSSCNVTFSSMLKNGKFNDVLLGQTFTLSLNVRANGSFASFPLCPNMTTQHIIGVYLDPNSTPTTFSIPSSVLSALGSNATVGGLLNLANQALGGASVGASLSDINTAVNNINVGFDGCRALIACD